MFNTTSFSNNESMNGGNSEGSWSYEFPVIALSRSARFWSMLVTTVPSVACSSILLYYLIADQNLRKLLFNHIIVALMVVGLFYQLIDIPAYLIYLHLGYVWPQAPISCIAWWFVGIGVFNTIGILMASASIERYILVFYEKWLITARQRLFIHYTPPMVLIAYGFIFYLIAIVFPPCQNQYLYDQDWCIGPCYYSNKFLATYDTVVNAILPTAIIVVFNVALWIRFVVQKHRLCRRVRWRQCRRMVIQLLSISTLFLLFNLPMTGIVLASMFGSPYGAGGQFELFTYFLCHFIPLLLPFVCLSASSDILVKVRNTLMCAQFNNRIRPFITATHRIE